MERNETKGFYNEVDAGLFNKDIVLAHIVINGTRAASEICNMHRICLCSLIYAFLPNNFKKCNVIKFYLAKT